ncbi:MAG TPA: glycosyltransferase [Spirochaetota bacterium]|nr:MAG: Chondroitin synthase [Spirochaetes bacterium ADurb.Bin133]HNZ26110.1 glycosyltransferase [Spirochaetota bacterium]HPY86573.1 glycosyltransferase [Spirochaetota bacterium]
MQISVIIPTRNRASLLSRTLNSIVGQTLKQTEFETLVIDNGSKDDTKKTVDSFINKIANLKYFYEETPGLHVGRHRGLKEAQSDILVYADDDIEAFPTWLEALKESFKDDKVVLVGGKILPKWEGEVPDWITKMWEKKNNLGQCLGYLSILDFGDNNIEIPAGFVFGCNFSIRKNILIEAGGFHPDGMPQELIKFRGDGESYVSKFIEEKKLKTIYNPDASVYHIITKERLTIEYFCKRAYNQGISDSYTYLRNNKSSLKTKRENTKIILKNIIKRLYLFIKKDKESLKIFKNYLNGFEFHKREFKRDINLKEWVYKKNYL